MLSEVEASGGEVPMVLSVTNVVLLIPTLFFLAAMLYGSAVEGDLGRLFPQRMPAAFETAILIFPALALVLGVIRAVRVKLRIVGSRIICIARLDADLLTAASIGASLLFLAIIFVFGIAENAAAAAIQRYVR